MSIHEYRPHGLHAAEVDKTRCRASVHSGDRAAIIYQCSRKAKVGGKWCGQHSPAAAKKRADDWQKKYDAERAADDRRYKRQSLEREAYTALLGGSADAIENASAKIKKHEASK